MNSSRIFAVRTSAPASHRRRRIWHCAPLIILLINRFSPAAQGLDFRLSTVSVVFDGYRMQQPFFHYDETNAVYLVFPGATWSAASEADSFTLTSSKFSGAQIRLEKSSSPAADTDFKLRTTLDDYQHRAMASVPKGATDITIMAEHDMPMDFYHWRNYEFVMDYAFFGQSFRRGIMFLDLNAKEQIVVSYSAPPDNFEAVRSMALRVLRSWRVAPLPSESPLKTDARP